MTREGREKGLPPRAKSQNPLDEGMGRFEQMPDRSKRAVDRQRFGVVEPPSEVGGGLVGHGSQKMRRGPRRIDDLSRICDLAIAMDIETRD